MDAILPDQTQVWQYLETTIFQLLKSYGYAEIRFPILERTELFKRSIGEVTDIVEKEMYTFDMGRDSLTLRPEGTAGCVRAVIDKGLIHNQQQRLWYAGPMFRHEKPQEGRFRQFSQIGVESFGFADVDIEFEQLLLGARIWKALNLTDVKLEINTLGTLSERNVYKQLLVDYLTANEDQLDEDSRRRLNSNPLRILDSKNPTMHNLLAAAPKLFDSLGDVSRSRFESLITLLDKTEIDYSVNPRLVRGLDYYSHTVYEWTTSILGTQGTVCAGGRFDDLVEQLGGRPNQAVGFAIGADRIVLMLQKLGKLPVFEAVDLYLVAVGEIAAETGFKLAEQLRNRFPEKGIKVNCGGGNFKTQMKRADRSGAAMALLLGDDEVNSGEVTLKYLRDDGKQIKISQSDLIGHIATIWH